MPQTKNYPWIDNFRIVAAILIVAIHTSPFLSFHETADFIFTRIFARVGVPFFFMATGFFVLPSALRKGKGGLNHFFRKGISLYIGATLIYLPLLVYKGYFEVNGIFLELGKDILFDGAFYHLWYLPAVLLGTAIVYFLLKSFSVKAAAVMVMIFYIIGLFGDSYYGFIEKAPLIKGFYDFLFEICDYTRNGVFFAPVYILLGERISEIRIRKNTALCGLVIFSLLLFGEGMFLKSLSVQRHDSMYFFLLPCMFFLFQALLCGKGKNNEKYRSISMLIYIIHPICIVLVRGIAKVSGLTDLLVENSLIHYIAVVLVSLAISILLTYKKPQEASPKGRAWLEINLTNLLHNVKELKKALPKQSLLMAVVKANAYGHGVIEISKAFNSVGIMDFAVATVSEGIALRQQGIGGNILVLGCTNPKDIHCISAYDLIQTVADYENALLYNEQGRKIRVHLKLDTGMHRLGEDFEQIHRIRKIYECENLLIEGVFSHLCVADSLEAEDISYTNRQIDQFYDAIQQLEDLGYNTGKIHIQSSYGVLNYPNLDCDYARIGICLYGVYSSEGDKTKIPVDLRPVLSLKARIVLKRKIEAGESVGYGRTFIAPCAMDIAVVSIGYADGIPRSLSNVGRVLVNGQEAPIIGRICMDQMIIDITDIPDVLAGDIVTVIGEDGEKEIKAEQVASAAKTITNELLCSLGERLPRIYTN